MEALQNLVDCRGMMCPAPILRVADAARGGKSDALTILATDPDFSADIEAWCRSARATLIKVEHRADGSIRAEVALAAKPKPAPAAEPKAAPIGKPNWLESAPVSSRAAHRAAATLKQTPNRPSGFAEPEGGILDLMGQESRSAMKHLQTHFLLGKPFEVVFERAEGPRLFAWASAVEAHVDVLARTETTIRVRIASDSTDRATPRATDSQHAANDELHKVQSVRATAETAPIVALPAAPANLDLPPRENQTTLLVLKNDYESLLSALMVANASAAQGMKVKVFFAFWAINMLRAPKPKLGTKRVAGFMQRMLKRMMPKGMADQRLGKLNMGGLGKSIFLWIMKRKNIMNLEQLVDQAVKQDIDFVVCAMSMGMMGVDKGEIVDLPNISFAGVTAFSAEARQSCTALVF